MVDSIIYHNGKCFKFLANHDTLLKFQENLYTIYPITLFMVEEPSFKTGYSAHTPFVTRSKQERHNSLELRNVLRLFIGSNGPESSDPSVLFMCSNHGKARLRNEDISFLETEKLLFRGDDN